MNKSNEIWSVGSGYAAALRAGVKVGPNGRFEHRPGDGMVAGYVFRRGTCVGQWKDVENRYLGLKFLIQGKVHYGWARLNVQCHYPHAIQATLTGYAYETIANKALITGKTKGPEGMTLVPGSLGALATGRH